ncbi:MAG TPA: c-type cytochrome [Xanthobacteraceae bacterium]|jgi:mono/diheme cytochrome c family protein|nr:c-type cytochrome [Xanthobacteraceae bacterium]
MEKTLKGFILGIIVAVIVIAGGAYAVIAAGLIPANADAAAGPVERFVARTDLRAVLRNLAPKDANPTPLTDDNLIAGIKLYGQHCAICHGTVSGEAPPIARGQYPKPPQLAKDGVEDDPEGWTFWKIKHGIRWTGMPAWKDEINDQDIWKLTLFLKNMDQLSPAAKQAWQALALPSAAASLSPDTPDTSGSAAPGKPAQ